MFGMSMSCVVRGAAARLVDRSRSNKSNLFICYPLKIAFIENVLKSLMGIIVSRKAAKMQRKIVKKTVKLVFII
jgi:hypothetical protein